MKACILAGGEGRRLRPLTSRLPKPMVDILGKPVLVHIIEKLKTLGITEMAVTLMYLPEVIKSALGDGGDLGVSLSYYTEETPLGTAGGVRACADMLDSDFLVISGDGMCDFDLSKAFELHREKDADVTVVLTPHENPLEYGLVQTGADGRIERFAEKPAWGQVFSNLVNTGIYVLSPRVLEKIPEGRPFDFAKDLFPLLLSENRPVYGCELTGYWCDIGDTEAYRRCVLDALGNRFSLPGGNAFEGGQEAHIRDGVLLIPPVSIHPAAVISQNTTIGPDAVIGENASIGERCSVSGSIVDGSLSPRCELDGAIVCAGASVGTGSILNSRTVIGSGARLGEACETGEGVRVFPDIFIPPGTFLRTSVTKGGSPRAVFEGGVIEGAFGTVLSPELCAAIGSACAALTESGPRRAAVGCSGAPDAVSLANAIAGGLTSGGSDVLSHDLAFASGAAAAAPLTSCSLSVFVDGSGELSIRIFDGAGRPISTAAQRKLEGMVARGEAGAVAAEFAGRLYSATGCLPFYASKAAEVSRGGRGLGAVVQGSHGAAAALRSAVSFAGFDRAEEGENGLTLAVSADGFGFSVSDGRFSCEGTKALAITLLAAFLDEPGLTVALPYDSPVAFDVIAQKNGGNLLRVGRDEGAAALCASQWFTRDAVFAAMKLLSFLSSGSSIGPLLAMLPRFSEHTLEVPCKSDRGRLMRRLSESCAGMSRELVGGLRVCVDGGYVRVTPCATRSALKIAAESFNEEIARELAVDFAGRAARMDGV